MNPLFEILFLITALVFCTPILTKSNIILMVVVVLWGYMIINNSTLTKRIKSSLYLPVTIYIILIFTYRFLGISDAAWGNYLNQLGFLSCILFMPFIRKGQSTRKWFLWIIWAVIVFNVVDNIFLSYLYPQINYARFYVDEEFLSSINAGGPSFYFLTLFVFNICFFSLLNSNSKRLRLPILICCILSAVYILGFCYKGITVIFFILSVVLIYYAKRSKSISQFITITISVLLFTIVIVLLFSEDWVAFIKAVSPHERLTARLVGLVDSNDIEAGSHSATSRTSLYLLSIKTWLSEITNFIYGIGDHRTLFGAASTGISQHSDLLDILPIYGLIGLTFIWIIFKNAFKIILSYFDNEYRIQVSTIFLLFILYGLVEKLFHPMAGAVMFLLLPLSAGLVNKKKPKL